jgi:hypothetical protein
MQTRKYAMYFNNMYVEHCIKKHAIFVSKTRKITKNYTLIDLPTGPCRHQNPPGLTKGFPPRSLVSTFPTYQKLKLIMDTHSLICYRYIVTVTLWVTNVTKRTLSNLLVKSKRYRFITIVTVTLLVTNVTKRTLLVIYL